MDNIIIKKVGGQIYKYSPKYGIWWNASLSPKCPIDDNDIHIKKNKHFITDKEKQRKHKWYLENRKRILEEKKEYNSRHQGEIRLYHQMAYQKKLKDKKSIKT